MQLGYRYLARSNHPLVRWARAVRRGVETFSIPAPRVIFRPLLLLVLAVRSCYYFVRRVFICEPLFKAYCREYGRHLHTDIYLHWVQGKGDIIAGDDVLFDGKISICFAARYAERPTLRVGSHSRLGHGCSFVIGKEIRIGNHCRFGGGVSVRDSSGHASDPEARKAGKPPADEEVRPVTICDNVWIGAGVFIGPGVTIGEGSIVAAHAVVFSDVAPYTVVAGNPARKIGSLAAPPSPSASDPSAKQTGDM